ncbi:hypothetical protein [Nocardia fluminea]|uniref:hypothetical protein n=1 Tax=Nocardia fluminea TaxID=134984 RepID=UPI0037B8D7DB
MSPPANDVAVGSKRATDIPGRETLESQSIGKNPMPVVLDRLIRRTTQLRTPSVRDREAFTVKCCAGKALTFRIDHNPRRRKKVQPAHLTQPLCLTPKKPRSIHSAPPNILDIEHERGPRDRHSIGSRPGQAWNVPVLPFDFHIIGRSHAEHRPIRSTLAIVLAPDHTPLAKSRSIRAEVVAMLDGREFRQRNFVSKDLTAVDLDRFKVGSAAQVRATGGRHG